MYIVYSMDSILSGRQAKTNAMPRSSQCDNDKKFENSIYKNNFLITLAAIHE